MVCWHFQHLSLMLQMCKLLGFPLQPWHSLDWDGWRGAAATSLHPIPSCSSSWAQQNLAFNYKVLFPTSAWLLTLSLPGTGALRGWMLRKRLPRIPGETCLVLYSKGIISRNEAPTPLLQFRFLPAFPGNKFCVETWVLESQIISIP